MNDTNFIFDASYAASSAGAGYIATLVSQFFKTHILMQDTLLSIIKKNENIGILNSQSVPKDAGKVIRRLIYFGCAFTIIFAPFLFAFFPDIPVNVESRDVFESYFWGLFPERVSVNFHRIDGFYLPDSIQQAFLNFLIPFYLGRGAAK